MVFGAGVDIGFEPIGINLYPEDRRAFDGKEVRTRASGEQDLIAVPPILTEQPLRISLVSVIVTMSMSIPLQNRRWCRAV